MYRTKIEPKIDKMFNDLINKMNDIVEKSSSSKETITLTTSLVSSELAIRSQSILSDMIFDLTNSLLKTEFFSDVSKRNKFYRVNLRSEIINKYQFSPVSSVNYKEVSRELQALKVGGVTLAAGGAIEVGAVLISGLSLSSLVPIPIAALVAVSIGAALTDYYAIEPARSKKALKGALDNYLIQTKGQFLNWFDEIERYFNKRVEEIKQTM